MPWQSLIQIPSFFEPPPGAPQQDDAAEFHAAQQFGNVVTWSLAAVMALSFLVDPPLVEAEAPPVEPSVVGSSHLVQVGKFESVLVIPSHGFEPPWPPTPDVVVEPPLSGANQVVLADPFYQTVLVPGSSFDPPWPPPAEVVDESPTIEVSRQLVGLMPLALRPAGDLSFMVEPPLDGAAEYVGADQVGNDPAAAAGPRTPGTLAEAPIEPNLPVVPVDDPLLALAAAQVGNLPFPVSPAQPRGTLAEPPPYETLPPPIPPEDASVVAGAQLVQVGKWYSALAIPSHSFDPPWDTSGGELPYDPTFLPPVTLAVPQILPAVRVGFTAEPPWDTSAGAPPFDPALLPPPAIGVPRVAVVAPLAFVIPPPLYPTLPVVPVEPGTGQSHLGIEERYGSQLQVDERFPTSLTIEPRFTTRLRISRRED